MKVTYEVLGETIVKKYEDGDSESLCLLEDIEIVIDRTRETLDRMEEKLGKIIKENENSAVSLMFHSYVEELNELKKIQLLNN